jgi:micrococcal nuclease
MSLKRILIFFLVIFLLGLLSVYYPKLTGEATNEEIQAQEYPLETAILTRVVDGDTIHALVNGENITIRMLGINAPEKKMPFSNESKAFLQQFENQTIQLLRDWENLDKYKRKLRYVYFEDRFLNKEILEKGYANTYYIAGLKYQSELLNAEYEAKTNEQGIWTKSQEHCSINLCIILKELNAQEEFFTIFNNCSFSCSLTSWFVKDAGRNTFYLSSLEAGESKTYYSKNNSEVWNNQGDRFFMFDKNGYLVLFYEYTS